MRYAYFDPLTRKVMGWIDTEAFDCVLPDKSMLLAIGDHDWELNSGNERWVSPTMTLTSSEPALVVTLDQVKADKLAQISADCAEEIVGGFACDALGAQYTYPSKPTDQSNLMASVLSSLTASGDEWQTPVWCYDVMGVGDYRSHSAVQVQAVGNASLSARNDALAKKADLEARVSSATKANQVSEINWAA
ncbi:hypothetical protein ALQ33_200045 [Pseudomonas syringae pv. philadelphi]|uniref:DUF4376 domain-containing protein n=1 Tax=Pseudomonas syringae pv. philadelphi TaxID=251706 RepID=A0A3M3YCU8_9PSED|nr:hypothetical protein [Pseudomonas syringae group genomosp. 3]RMO79785.1 hypothetical protein ALQ33_200045 [Pseudomonas syringae pv. philadelphi]